MLDWPGKKERKSISLGLISRRNGEKLEEESNLAEGTVQEKSVR